MYFNFISVVELPGQKAELSNRCFLDIYSVILSLSLFVVRAVIEPCKVYNHVKMISQM